MTGMTGLRRKGARPAAERFFGSTPEAKSTCPPDVLRQRGGRADLFFARPCFLLFFRRDSLALNLRRCPLVFSAGHAGQFATGL